MLSIEQHSTCNGGPGLKEHLKLLLYRGGLEDFLVEPSFVNMLLGKFLTTVHAAGCSSPPDGGLFRISGNPPAKSEEFRFGSYCNLPRCFFFDEYYRKHFRLSCWLPNKNTEMV